MKSVDKECVYLNLTEKMEIARPTETRDKRARRQPDLAPRVEGPELKTR